MKTQFGYVYRTEHLPTGRVYIGQKTGPFDPKYLGSGTRIINAIRKYGRSQFSVQVLNTAISGEALDVLERRHISEARKKFETLNLSDGGQSRWHHSLESKLAISAAKRGIKRPELGRRMQGRKRPKSFCIKMRQLYNPNFRKAAIVANLGRKLSPERCAAMSAVRKGRKHSAIWRARIKESWKIRRQKSNGVWPFKYEKNT